jgi:hypothetical protein
MTPNSLITESQLANIVHALPWPKGLQAPGVRRLSEMLRRDAHRGVARKLLRSALATQRD